MRVFLPSLLMGFPLAAQYFAGASGGISTLSADAAKSGSPAVALSQYKPENGGTLTVFAGKHLSDWWSLQAAYGWNRNQILLSGLNPAGSYDVSLRSNMHTGMAEVQLYFRPRENRIRPYLAAGPGVVAERTAPNGVSLVVGRVDLPQMDSKVSFAFRVAVGIDARISRRVSLRYSFAETLQGNVFSERLAPAGSRKLANFQNQWGAVWRF